MKYDIGEIVDVVLDSGTTLKEGEIIGLKRLKDKSVMVEVMYANTSEGRWADWFKEEQIKRITKKYIKREKQDWEKEFEKKFSISFNVGVVPDDITKQKIKDFIKDILQKQKEKALGCVPEENIIDVFHFKWPEGYTEEKILKNGWNVSREQTIKNLKEKL